MNALSRRFFYIVSLSARTLIYKGMLTARQLEPMFPDLSDPDLESALALVHQRFSTNTFPSWPLAHPYRLIAHNGEINTLRGNINWMRAREGLLQSDVFGDDLRKLLPVIREGGSDTATFDNVLELLVMAGRSLPHAILMMIPEPWSRHDEHEPGAEGVLRVPRLADGAVGRPGLDRLHRRHGHRRGARPQRAASVALLRDQGRSRHHGLRGRRARRPPENVLVKERLHPGHLPRRHGQGPHRRRRGDQAGAGGAAPVPRVARRHLVDIDDLPEARAERPEHETVFRGSRRSATRRRTCAAHRADGENGEEPIGSMGTDTALAVLSDVPRLLYDYFKQLFAQVTNPPLDAIREELVTDMGSTIGPERNLLKPEPESCRQIRIKYPIIHNEHVAKLRHLPPDVPFRSTTLSMLFDPEADGPGLERGDGGALPPCQRGGGGRLRHPDPVGSRRGAAPCAHPEPARDGRRAPSPGARGDAHALRARGRVGRRARGASRGAAARLRRRRGQPVRGVRDDRRHDPAGDAHRHRPRPAIEHYIKALNKGVLKVMSKMGISTLQSYCGAQIFEAIGLRVQAFIDRYFTHTTSRVGGAAST
jgi:glutamate synthase (NADPH) large chain